MFAFEHSGNYGEIKSHMNRRLEVNAVPVLSITAVTIHILLHI